MIRKMVITATVMISIYLLITSCQKTIAANDIQTDSYSSTSALTDQVSVDGGAVISEIPLSLTIYNPCCQEQIYLTGTIHRVENSNVIHTNSQDISGIGLSSGLLYSVNSNSVRNYVFDPNEYLATLNWSIRMMGENGCGYNVQFIVHVTRDPDGEIRASIHSGNFFCL